jgi:DNA-binding CsgD family transcriptional regulator
MELVERGAFLNKLLSEFEKVSGGEGHCVFVYGDAGIGKTSLIKAFCTEVKDRCNIYQGTCDALFTPRPLAPLYDIVIQLKSDFYDDNYNVADRSAFFTSVFQLLKNEKETSVVVFEDIHWADDATLDFIKFLARRITQLRCLCIFTYRDGEIHAGHHLRTILGQLNPETFTRMQLPLLSREAVEKMAEERGYNGEDVYSISGGNPFYVNEILASYSTGIPENIRDSVLSVYSRLDEKERHVWQVLSVLPTPFEASYLVKMDTFYATIIEECLLSKILVIDKGLISFKHELFRRTIEESLSPLAKIELNKKILEVFLEHFEQNQKTEQIVHHAKNANEYDFVVHYAPIAAEKAVSVGAHTEAAKLYLSAIEYYQGNDIDTLIQFYEPYAYECYLTNQIKNAIIYSRKALHLWERKDNPEMIGNSMRFLSRLWWFDGNRRQAESFGRAAIEVLDKQPPSKAKAMAYSNMSQLKMLSDEAVECIHWGEKAIAMAKELGDEEILSHALNNVGDVEARILSSRENGIRLMRQSLDIALKNGYHEHVARAYTNLGHNSTLMKDYEFARKFLLEGIQYCEERDLDSWSTYMLSNKARLELEIGHWNEAFRITDCLIHNEDSSPVVKVGALAVFARIKMRKGDDDVLPLLTEAKEIAFEMLELQRIIPAMVALLEYEWVTGNHVIEKEAIDTTISMVRKMGNQYENSEFAFWLFKARRQHIHLDDYFEGYNAFGKSLALEAAKFWESRGCPYEEALMLFEGNNDDKRQAISIIHGLGATAVYEKMKFEMRRSGIKKIPRGARKTTQSNSSYITERELEILQLLYKGLQNKEIASKLFISPKTVDHHISSILYKLEVNSRAKAVREAIRLEIIK